MVGRGGVGLGTRSLKTACRPARDSHQYQYTDGAGWGILTLKTTCRPAHDPHHHQHGHANVQNHSQPSSPSAWIGMGARKYSTRGEGVHFLRNYHVLGPRRHTASEIIVLRLAPKLEVLKKSQEHLSYS